MTADALDLRLLVAAAVVREAGQLARDFFTRREQLEIEHKGMQDLVSIADRQVEEVIRTHIAQAFPGDGIMGEEGETIEPPSGAGSWVIDPIDGTANFLRGVPYWSVALAYVRNGVTEIGVTFDPNHDELFAAARGRGATRNGRKIQVSGCSGMSRAIIGSTFTFKMKTEDYVELLRGVLGAGADHRRLGSTALMMCHVADGRLDGCATLYCNSWDIIGGLLLVQEAGGVASDFLDGASLSDPNRAFACTPALADTIAGLVGLRA
jgi:myo-inositol-1(or 4)-monophosphatase